MCATRVKVADGQWKRGSDLLLFSTMSTPKRVRLVSYQPPHSFCQRCTLCTPNLKRSTGHTQCRRPPALFLPHFKVRSSLGSYEESTGCTKVIDYPDMKVYSDIYTQIKVVNQRKWCYTKNKSMAKIIGKK